jgi:homoserine dehydrogenase
VYCEGIAKLDLLDLELAQKELGYGLKLLGIAKAHLGQIETRVHPTFLPHTHPFLSVRDEYNAISIVGDAVGDIMLYGKGAGMMPAASAVVSDIIFLSRHVARGTAGKLPYVTYEKNQKVKILSPDQIKSKYYLRFSALDQPGVLAKIAGILGKHGVSIDAVYQPQIGEKKHWSHAIILVTTHLAKEGKVQKAIQKINGLPFIKAKTVLIRIEE